MEKDGKYIITICYTTTGTCIIIIVVIITVIIITIGEIAALCRYTDRFHFEKRLSLKLSKRF